MSSFGTIMLIYGSNEQAGACAKLLKYSTYFINSAPTIDLTAQITP